MDGRLLVAKLVLLQILTRLVTVSMSPYASISALEEAQMNRKLPGAMMQTADEF